MNCKKCGCLIERSIEGELMCEDCWEEAQMSDEEIAFEKEVHAIRTHCSVCDVPLTSDLQRERMQCNDCWDETIAIATAVPENCCVCDEPIIEGKRHLCYELACNQFPMTEAF